MFFKSYNTKRVTSMIELCKQRQVSMLVREQNATLNCMGCKLRLEGGILNRRTPNAWLPKTEWLFVAL